MQVLQDYDKNPEEVDLKDPGYLKRVSDRMPDIGRKVHPATCASLLLDVSVNSLRSIHGGLNAYAGF